VSSSLKSEFLLDPDVVFLNHGSFGACPRVVFETYQRWQYELERQPVDFLGRRVDDLLNPARAALAEYVGAASESVAFVPNATTGINTIVRSLPLEPGDEILTTNHEYGAMDYTWEFVCGKTGARYIRHEIPLPVTTVEELVEAFWSKVTPKTRVIFMSHITSPSALILPVTEICRRARQAGIWTVVDGAHAPGQIPLDLTAMDVDFYSGNCHKWLCAPKGAGFLYARAEYHHLVDPLVISWGYVKDATFVTRNQWQGTRDVSAFLSVPAAIEFQKQHNWDEVRQRCHTLASEARQRIIDLTGQPAISPDSPTWFAQMFTASLFPGDMAELKRRLYDEYRVEVPIGTRDNLNHIRVSIQGYNTLEDVDRLIHALSQLQTSLQETKAQ